MRIVTIKGFSLIEVLLSVGISVVCLSCILMVYLASQHNLQLQLSIQNEIISAELAADVLRLDVHLAGYIGCAKLTDEFSLISHLSYSLTPATKLVGGDSELTLIHASIVSSNLITHEENTLVVNNTEAFHPDDIVIISDCMKAEILKVNTVTQHNHLQTLTFVEPLHFVFDSMAEVSKLEVNHYFIAATDQMTINNKPIYALYKRDIHNDTEELVDGISNLNIQYTIFQNNSVIDVSADRVLDWSGVKGVSVAMTVQSGNLTKDWQVYAAI